MKSSVLSKLKLSRHIFPQILRTPIVDRLRALQQAYLKLAEGFLRVFPISFFWGITTTTTVIVVEISALDKLEMRKEEEGHFFPSFIFRIS